MTTTSNFERIIRSLPSHHTSRASAFHSLFIKGEFTLDLYTVDRLLQQNDHELCVEVVSLMLDYLHCENRLEQYPVGCHASYQAIINRLGINKGAIEIDHEYLAPLLALLPDNAITAAGYPNRKELCDMIHVLRQRTDWTSETFTEAMQSSTWQLTYTDLSEMYAINVDSDIRIESLHYGKLFELLFYRPLVSSTVTVPVKEDKDDDEKKIQDEDQEQDEDDKDEDDQDEDGEVGDEIEVVDPLNEDVSEFNYDESIGEFLSWIGFKNPTTAEKLFLSNQSAQISQFLGMSYYHAVSAVLGVVFSLIQKQQRHLNFRIVYMFHQWFFQNSFPVPEIIQDYEKPQLEGIEGQRGEQVYFLSYEKRLREMDQFSPDQPDHDIGVTKRVQNLPFITETRLMYITAMMEASVYNGGTHINATSGFVQYLDGKRTELGTVKEEYDEAEENGDDTDELLEKVEMLTPTVDTNERYLALLERFHEAMYTHFNTQFSSYTCIIVAWIISVCQEDKASQDIIEKFFGVNEQNWNDYDAEAYYSALQASCGTSVADCGIDFTWATPEFCAELDQARVMLYNLTKPCSDYDDLLYCILAQLIMIDHIDGIDWVMKKTQKTTLAEVTNTVLYGRLSLFSFANQLDEADLTTTKALVKRKAKVVVNNQYSESSNIFVSTFCDPHLSDDQVLTIFKYWRGFCERNPKSNKLHINMYELYAILNRAWAFRYTRASRSQSLQYFAEEILPPTTIEQMVTTQEPNFLQLFFSTLTAQSSYSDVAANGNTSSRYGDFACIAYEQDLLGLIYAILFPTLSHLGKALQLFQSPAQLFTPIFVFQSKKAFDHLFFDLKLPARLEIIALIINSMLPSVDWSSCVDVRSILLQYQQFVFTEKNKASKKKGKKGTKKGAKGKKAAPVEEEEEPAVVTPAKQPPADNYTITGDSLRSSDTQFFSFSNTTMLTSMRQLELNTMVQFNTLINDELTTDVKKQQKYVEEIKEKIIAEYGSDAIAAGSFHQDEFATTPIAIRQENKHTVDFFNDEKNTAQVESATFNTFNNQILALYKDSLLSPHKANEELSKSELGDLNDEINALFHTLQSNDTPPSLGAKYGDIELDTTVLDALIWFVDKNEKTITEEYGGCELSYGFILYTFAALITLFIQITETTITDDDNESPATQLAKLYAAMIQPLSTPQGSPIHQTLQLLFKTQTPLPNAYQHCLLRVSNDQLRHFYSPWVQSLYSQYGNTRMLSQLALDLEREVQESPQGRRLIIGDNSKINAKITWDVNGITTEYTPTTLFQIMLTTISTECLAQAYIVAFQQHYPQRVQYLQSLMRAQYQRQQQASPYCTHTFKFTGLAQMVHIVDTFKQLSYIPTQIPYLLSLFSALDVTTTIATTPDLENIQSVWKFYATQRLKRDPTAPEIAFLAHGSHQSWLIDVFDTIMSRPGSQNNVKLLQTAVKPTSDEIIVNAYNPLINHYVAYSQLFTPISRVNEVLTMNYWTQLSHTFGSLVTSCNQFFLLSPQVETPHDDKAILGDFDANKDFTLLTTDPTFIDGVVHLYNKYVSKGTNDATPEQFKAVLTEQLHKMTECVGKHEDQTDEINAKVQPEILAKFDIENVIKGIVPPPPAPVEKPKAKFSAAAMMGMGAPSIPPPKETKPAASTSASETKPVVSAQSEPKKEAEAIQASTDSSSSPSQDIVHTTHDDAQPASGAMGTVLALGAVAGLVGAAIYAGLTYFQAQQKNNASEQPQRDDDQQ